MHERKSRMKRMKKSSTLKLDSSCSVLQLLHTVSLIMWCIRSLNTKINSRGMCSWRAQRNVNRWLLSNFLRLWWDWLLLGLLYKPCLESMGALHKIGGFQFLNCQCMKTFALIIQLLNILFFFLGKCMRWECWHCIAKGIVNLAIQIYGRWIGWANRRFMMLAS